MLEERQKIANQYVLKDENGEPKIDDSGFYMFVSIEKANEFKIELYNLLENDVPTYDEVSLYPEQPIDVYQSANIGIPSISERFEPNIPPYHRNDLGVTLGDKTGKAATANTNRITITNKTMTSVTFTYNFAPNDKNRYMFFYDSHTNDWDWNISTWNDRGVLVNPPISGTVTVNNLMPEGTYKIRMSYNNTGTWVYDYYEFTMPSDTSGITTVIGDKMMMTIPTYLYNMLGASEANRYIQALDRSYSLLADLVGNEPYDGAMINIVPNKHTGAYIARSGNPISFREAYLIEDFLYFKRPIGLSVYSNHELSHDFDVSRRNFDSEFFCLLQVSVCL